MISWIVNPHNPNIQSGLSNLLDMVVWTDLTVTPKDFGCQLYQGQPDLDKTRALNGNDRYTFDGLGETKTAGQLGSAQLFDDIASMAGRICYDPLVIRWLLDPVLDGTPPTSEITIDYHIPYIKEIIAALIQTMYRVKVHMIAVTEYANPPYLSFLPIVDSTAIYLPSDQHGAVLRALNLDKLLKYRLVTPISDVIPTLTPVLTPATEITEFVISQDPLYVDQTYIAIKNPISQTHLILTTVNYPPDTSVGNPYVEDIRSFVQTIAGTYGMWLPTRPELLEVIDHFELKVIQTTDQGLLVQGTVEPAITAATIGRMCDDICNESIGLPLIPIVGSWIYDLRPTRTDWARLYYGAVQAYLELCDTAPELADRIGLISVGSDFTVIVPVTHLKQVQYLRVRITDLLRNSRNWSIQPMPNLISAITMRVKIFELQPERRPLIIPSEDTVYVVTVEPDARISAPLAATDISVTEKDISTIKNMLPPFMVGRIESLTQVEFKDIRDIPDITPEEIHLHELGYELDPNYHLSVLRAGIMGVYAIQGLPGLLNYTAPNVKIKGQLIVDIQSTDDGPHIVVDTPGHIYTLFDAVTPHTDKLGAVLQQLWTSGQLVPTWAKGGQGITSFPLRSIWPVVTAPTTQPTV